METSWGLLRENRREKCRRVLESRLAALSLLTFFPPNSPPPSMLFYLIELQNIRNAVTTLGKNWTSS